MSEKRIDVTPTTECDFAHSKIFKLRVLQPMTNKYSADFQGCFEDVRAFLILILCSLSIPLGL